MKLTTRDAHRSTVLTTFAILPFAALLVTGCSNDSTEIEAPASAPSTSSEETLPADPEVPAEEKALDNTLAADCTRAGDLISKQMDDNWALQTEEIDEPTFRDREAETIGLWSDFAAESTSALEAPLQELAAAAPAGELNTNADFVAAQGALQEACTANKSPIITHPSRGD